MSGSSSIENLLEDWSAYLEQRGHQVKLKGGDEGMLSSKNSKGRRYQWILFQAKRGRFRLTANDHERIQQQINVSRKADHQVYVVVRFNRPVSKVLVIPATRAARIRLLRADKGGIPWDDWHNNL